jgi:hypothetical protein
MLFGKANALLMLTVIVPAILIHTSAAHAASPCRPNPVYIPTIGGSGTGITDPMWRQHTTDFNGDGCADLAIGVPFEDIDNNTKVDGGAVNILYGLTSGLSAAGNQLFDQGSPDSIAGAPEAEDGFGAALR